MSHKKKLTKKQKDNAFIKKIGSLTMGGKAVGKPNDGCPVCGKKGKSHAPFDAWTAVKWCPEPEHRHDDSQESSLCN